MRAAAPAAVLAALALALAACGGDDEGSSAGAGGRTKALSVTETEFALDPAKITLDRPGTYCPVGNHREQGMEGTVTVKGGSSAMNRY